MRIDRGLLLGVIALLLVLSTSMVLPYLQFVLAAVVLTFVLHPLQGPLAGRIGETPAAAVLVGLSLVAIVVPFLFVVTFVVRSAMRYAGELQGLELDLTSLEQSIATYTGREVDVTSAVQSALGSVDESLFGGAITAFETLTHLAIGLGLLFFLLFFFVRDGDRFVAWFRRVSPLPGPVVDDLLERLHDITRAVLAGHVLVAIIQGVLAGLGLAVAGVPNAAFWTFIMIVLALIPLIGTFLVWAPASLYLAWNGRLVAAALLFAYGSIVVGVSDDYLRPVVVDRYARINPSVIIVGVIGGFAVFGVMGLFVGPIVVGALKATIELYDEHYGRHPGQTR